MKEEQFRECPNCKKRNKIIIRCPDCFKFCCNECSIDTLCIDCFIESSKIIELNHYYDDKYKVLI